MSVVVWWEVETPDPEAFQRFHAAMWGWEFRPAFQDTALNRDYWLILAGGSGIGGLQRALRTDPPRAGTRFYLEVDDLEGTVDRALAAGAQLERPRTALGGDDRWFGIITDPAGISVGLWTASPRS